MITHEDEDDITTTCICCKKRLSWFDEYRRPVGDLIIRPLCRECFEHKSDNELLVAKASNDRDQH